ncbi:terminase small subunit [Enterococcus gallinarum]|uniref:terminase small subunit n=1 Tax=Enterococcus gallinarum TaxID=1353 RepID=UPI00132FAE63|nr:terminase small subunit [Enterococcus gallinarum]
MSLKPKQRAFADEYIITGNAEQSALKAGYSESYARGQSYKLLANVGIKEYIDQRVQEIQNEKILSQTEILVMLSEIAKGEIPELKEVVTKKGEFVVNPNSEDGKKQLVYNESVELIPIPPKTSDKNKALELLGKRYAMWTDKQDITANEVVTIVDDIDE